MNRSSDSGCVGLRGSLATRREVLRVGGLTSLGLSLASLLGTRAFAAPAAGAGRSTLGRAKSCILIFLAGGPPQHETFDPKPEAPSEIRGEFGSIATSVPGVRFSELLPRTARLARQLTVIRSMATGVHAHSTSGYYMLTGNPHDSNAESLPPGPNDWPSLASVVAALKPSHSSPISAAVVPAPIMNNPNIHWPGQNGGFMGPTWDPQFLNCDPSQDELRIEGMDRPPDVSAARFVERVNLAKQIDQHFARVLSQEPALAALSRLEQQALQVLGSSAARDAFRIERETDRSRDRYGRFAFGQSLLLARRLVESGVRLVQVNWPRDAQDSSTLWDTHADHFRHLRNLLCPRFDTAFSALIEDLDARGLLDETLVVVLGEFGRTPKVNAQAGRDHWGSCFSVALAGAGVPGGQVVGASNRHGAFPVERPFRPQDLTATILHLLGIDPDGEFLDRLQRPRRLVDGGAPIREIVGV